MRETGNEAHHISRGSVAKKSDRLENALEQTRMSMKAYSRIVSGCVAHEIPASITSWQRRERVVRYDYRVDAHVLYFKEVHHAADGTFPHG
jgi:hypothetical protein